MEAVDWVLADLQEDHDWISEFSLALQENKFLHALHYDFCSLRRSVSTMTC